MATTPVTDLLHANTSLASDQTSVDREEITRLAQQFEAMLMTQMMREMRRSMLDDEAKGDGFGGDVFTDTGDIEFGLAMSRGGGLGLTGQLLSAFEQQVNGAAANGAETPAVDDDGVTAPVPALLRRALSAAAQAGAPAVVAPATAPPATAMARLDTITSAAPAAGSAGEPAANGDAPVSSRFGWRRDPFTGAAQFHRGVDLAVAYGHEVKAADAGTVSFAGTQGGYGQTVVIDHGGGRQTRYAHLSASLVRQGDVVEAGQLVARSGNSGRSTGAHLHIERIVNGVAVDPLETLAGE